MRFESPMSQAGVGGNSFAGGSVSWRWEPPFRDRSSSVPFHADSNLSVSQASSSYYFLYIITIDNYYAKCRISWPKTITKIDH